MYYENTTPPIDLGHIWAVARDVRSDPKAFHHSLKHLPDRWGIGINGTGTGAFKARVSLTMEWDFDDTERPRYTRIKHVRRIMENFSERLLPDMLVYYDLMDIEVSLEKRGLSIHLSAEVCMRATFEAVEALLERDNIYEQTLAKNAAPPATESADQEAKP